MIDWVIAVLLLTGATFVLIAAVGIVRMPDVYQRLQAESIAVSFGSAGILIAVAIFFNDIRLATRAILGIAFLALTIPIAAQMIARAAYLTGVQPWERTVADELREYIEKHGVSALEDHQEAAASEAQAKQAD